MGTKNNFMNGKERGREMEGDGGKNEGVKGGAEDDCRIVQYLLTPYMR